MAEANKRNRSKFDGPSHSGGSIPFHEHARRLQEDGVIDPSTLDWAVFKHTHTSKDDRDRWCNDKTKATADGFTRLREEKDSQVIPGEDASSVASDNDLIVQASGGVNRKERLQGTVAQQEERAAQQEERAAQQEKRVAQQQEKAAQQEKKGQEQDSLMVMMQRRMDKMEKLLRRLPEAFLDTEDDDETQPPSQDLGDDYDHAGHPPA
ncbi:uncharacterized protein LOC133306809 [Gastrolobium bilobum]|uniref:uncharacterized protein LOC133306809 n=1 Tax=Gastrolobium bilobum TaxID=150636 RepID=UPI002AB2D7CE|nr:uncharacterized protein LOC133306809 [Gastrolobium bilobum]